MYFSTSSGLFFLRNLKISLLIEGYRFRFSNQYSFTKDLVLLIIFSQSVIWGKIGEIKRAVGIFALWSSFKAFIFCSAVDDRSSICFLNFSSVIEKERVIKAIFKLL